MRHLKLLFAATLLLLASCAKESDSLVFTAKAPDYHTNAKDYVTPGSGSYDVRWSNGDQMVINGNTYAMSVNEMANSATVNATEVTPIGGKFYAAYPASLATVDGSGNVTFTLPAVEHYSAIASGAGAGEQRVNNLMVAATSGTQLNFTNVCSLLHFVLSGATGSLVAIEVASDQPIAGTINAHYDAGSWTSSPAFSASDTCRRLLFDTPLSLSSGQDIYMLMPAVSVTKFRLRFFVQMASGEVKVFQRANTGNSGMTFSAANLYNFGAISYSDMLANYADVSPDGSESNPYLMFNGTNWSYYMGGSVSSTDKYFELRNDLTVSDVITTTFNGTLDGKGHTVTLANNKALLKEISGATLKNLTVTAASTFTAPEGYTINSTTSFSPFVCYASSSSFTDCVNRVNVSNASQSRVAGVCSHAMNTTFERCLNYGNLTTTGGTDLAGIVTRIATSGSIEDCINYGNLTTTTTEMIYLGGISSLIGCPIVDCVNEGLLIVATESITTVGQCGGIVAKMNNYSSSRIEGCSNLGEIRYQATSNSQSFFYLGGIVGDLSSPNPMINCFNNANLNTASGCKTTKLYVGGLCGHFVNNTISNSFVIGDLSGLYTGGLVGRSNATQATSISNCYYWGTLPDSRSAGVVGSIQVIANLTVANCYYSSNRLSVTDFSNYSNCATLTDATTLSSAVTLTDGVTTTTSLVEALNDRVTGSWWPWTTSGGYVIFNH
ncbi:MAG: hypothetical protein K5864_01350 [Bacteroidales bacterium]|nr:hypothetical protein [Bacteroidales bacterium]